MQVQCWSTSQSIYLSICTCICVYMYVYTYIYVYIYIYINIRMVSEPVMSSRCIPNSSPSIDSTKSPECFALWLSHFCSVTWHLVTGHLEYALLQQLAILKSTTSHLRVLDFDPADSIGVDIPRGDMILQAATHAACTPVACDLRRRRRENLVFAKCCWRNKIYQHCS